MFPPTFRLPPTPTPPTTVNAPVSVESEIVKSKIFIWPFRSMPPDDIQVSFPFALTE